MGFRSKHRDLQTLLACLGLLLIIAWIASLQRSATVRSHVICIRDEEQALQRPCTSVGRDQDCLSEYSHVDRRSALVPEFSDVGGLKLCRLCGHEQIEKRVSGCYRWSPFDSRYGEPYRWSLVFEVGDISPAATGPDRNHGDSCYVNGEFIQHDEEQSQERDRSMFAPLGRSVSVDSPRFESLGSVTQLEEAAKSTNCIHVSRHCRVLCDISTLLDNGEVHSGLPFSDGESSGKKKSIVYLSSAFAEFLCLEFQEPFVAPDEEVTEFASQNHAERRCRVQLGDKSALRIWLAADDDIDDYVPYRRLLSYRPTHDRTTLEGSSSTPSQSQGTRHSRTLLRDISPPGMWQVDDDDYDDYNLLLLD